MTLRSGGSTRIGIVKATTFGTPVAVSTGAKLECDNFDVSENAEQLMDMPIGAGQEMINDCIRGATEPKGNFTKKLRFDDSANIMTTILYGGASVVAQASSTYAHSLYFNMARNNQFATIVRETTLGSLLEVASCTPTKRTLKLEKFPNYVTEQIEYVGNAINFQPSTNSTTTLAAMTTANVNRVIAQPSDTFRINLQGGAALSGSDAVNITSAEISYDYPVMFPDEMKGSAGNGQPIADGDPPFSVTLTVSTRGLDDAQYRMFINSQTNTQYKADLTITSTTMAGGAIPYSRKFFFPCLVMLEDPQNSLGSTKVNPCTLKFKAMIATSTPSGMLDFYPHETIVNTRSTTYIA